MKKYVLMGLVFSLLLALLALPACDRPQMEVIKLQKDTEYIHDEAMQDLAKMNRIGRLLKKDLTTLDSLSPRRDSIVQVLAQMGQFEDEMMDWMKNYQAPDPKSPDAKSYLESQKTLIEQNHRNICTALRAGELLQSK